MNRLLKISDENAIAFDEFSDDDDEWTKWQAYEAFKHELRRLPLSAEQYEQQIEWIVRELGL